MSERGVHSAGVGSFAACIVILVLASAISARADDGAGAFRLGLGADLFDWHSQDWFRAAPGVSDHREGFDFVLAAPRFELQVAGQVTPEIAVGAAIGLGWGTQSETGRADASVGSYLAQALVEYALWPGAVARPFARAALGVNGAEHDHQDLAIAHYSVVLFDVAATLGVHVFAARSFSLSPYARVYYATGPGRETAVASGTTGLNTNFVAVSVGLELIGWIGGSPPGPVASAPATGPSTHATITVPDAPVLRDGVLEIDVALSGGARGGELSAEPAHDPGVVEVRFATSARRPELEHCEVIEVVEGDTRTGLPLSVERIATESRSHLELRFRATPGTVALLASRRASLEACGRHFDFAASSSRTVLSFLASLLELAAEPSVEAPAVVEEPAIVEEPIVIPPPPASSEPGLSHEEPGVE